MDYDINEDYFSFYRNQSLTLNHDSEILDYKKTGRRILDLEKLKIKNRNTICNIYNTPNFLDSKDDRSNSFCKGVQNGKLI